MRNHAELAGTVGAVLDPVLALRVTVEIAAGQSGEAIFTTYLARDRDEAQQLAGSYCKLDEATVLFERNTAGSGEVLAELGISEGQASEFQELAGTLLYGIRPAGKLPEEPAIEPSRDDLLALEITGEWPIILATIDSPGGMPRLEGLLAMHSYWRMKGIACDLVVLCGGEKADLLDQVTSLVGNESERLNRPRGVWGFSHSSLTEKQNTLLQSIARIRVDCEKGSTGGAIDG